MRPSRTNSEPSSLPFSEAGRPHLPEAPPDPYGGVPLGVEAAWTAALPVVQRNGQTSVLTPR
jgi:hypothetical protein